MTDTNTLQKTTASNPAEMIQAAVQSGADLEKLEKLLTLQERWEANEAKKAYYKAMAEFKANPPQIFKDKTVAYSQTRYKHASLGNVVEKITARLSECGLSHSWRVKQNGVIEVSCRITHEKGYSEETSISAGADKSGAKNDIQSIGSAITYLQRYTLLAMTGLATEDQDNDARPAETATIDDKQAATIEEYLETLKEKVNRPKFLKFFKIEKVSDMPKDRYQEAISLFKAKEGAK